MAFAVGFVFAPLRRRKRTAVPTRVGRGCEVLTHTPELLRSTSVPILRWQHEALPEVDGSHRAGRRRLLRGYCPGTARMPYSSQDLGRSYEAGPRSDFPLP